MMIYENKKTGDRVKVKASSLVLSEVEVTFISSDKHEVGSTSFYKISTFKRWWKLVEEVKEEADNDIKEDIDYTESELTDAEYAKIGLEIAEQAKKKASSHKLVPMPGIEKLEELRKEYSDNNIYTFISVPSKKGFNLVKLDNKTIAHIYIRKSYILVYLKEKLDSYNYEIKNYKGSFSYLYKVLSESEMYDILNNVIKE